VSRAATTQHRQTLKTSAPNLLQPDPDRLPKPCGPALYTEDERRRRDASPWTLVQGVLAPLQFLVFLVSLGLVLRFLVTDEGAAAATASVVAKTMVLYAIMITGSIWERDVFGQYLFARPFFWEDVVSMAVLALHTAYLASVAFDWLGLGGQMVLALVAYAAYVVNAAQFLLKFRRARLQSAADQPLTAGAWGATP
jgi:3-vinyl bacteriochlorophyllide hydratase